MFTWVSWRRALDFLHPCAVQDNLRLTSSQETAILSARSTMLDKLRAIGRQRRQLLSGLAMELLQTPQVKQCTNRLHLLQSQSVAHVTKPLNFQAHEQFAADRWLLGLCWTGAAGQQGAGFIGHKVSSVHSALLFWCLPPVSNE